MSFCESVASAQDTCVTIPLFDQRVRDLLMST